MINMGDRVAYDYGDEVVPSIEDTHGTVVEPTELELEAIRSIESLDFEDVLVEWDDGDRCWEHPSRLVVIEGVGS